MFAVNDTHKVILYDLTTKQPQIELLLEANELVISVEISDDQKYLFLARVPNNQLLPSLLIFDIEKRSYIKGIDGLRNLFKEEGNVHIYHGIKMSPDSSILLLRYTVYGEADRIAIIDFPTLQLISIIRDIGNIYNIKFAPNSPFFYTETSINNIKTFMKWNFQGELITKINADSQLSGKSLKFLNYHPVYTVEEKGSLLFAIKENNYVDLVRLSSDFQNINSVTKIPHLIYPNVKFSEDGTELVIVDGPFRLQIYNIASWESVSYNLNNYTAKDLTFNDLFIITPDYFIYNKYQPGTAETLWYSRNYDQVTKFSPWPGRGIEYHFAINSENRQLVAKAFEILPAVRALWSLHRNQPQAMAADVVMLVIRDLLAPASNNETKINKLATFLRDYTQRIENKITDKEVMRQQLLQLLK
jgi:WD40 repeat protein